MLTTENLMSPEVVFGDETESILSIISGILHLRTSIYNSQINRTTSHLHHHHHHQPIPVQIHHNPTDKDSSAVTLTSSMSSSSSSSSSSALPSDWAPSAKTTTPTTIIHPTHISTGSSLFHGIRVPPISIRDYVTRIKKYSFCSISVLVTALEYLNRIRNAHHDDLPLSDLTVHRMYLTAVLLAVKFQEDVYYDNAHFARVGGVSLKDLNRMEFEMLQRLDFRLHVTQDRYKELKQEIYLEAKLLPLTSN